MSNHAVTYSDPVVMGLSSTQRVTEMKLWMVGGGSLELSSIPGWKETSWPATEQRVTQTTQVSHTQKSWYPRTFVAIFIAVHVGQKKKRRNRRSPMIIEVWRSPRPFCVLPAPFSIPGNNPKCCLLTGTNRNVYFLGQKRVVGMWMHALDMLEVSWEAKTQVIRTRTHAPLPWLPQTFPCLHIRLGDKFGPGALNDHDSCPRSQIYKNHGILELPCVVDA